MASASVLLLPQGGDPNSLVYSPNGATSITLERYQKYLSERERLTSRLEALTPAVSIDHAVLASVTESEIRKLDRRLACAFDMCGLDPINWELYLLGTSGIVRGIVATGVAKAPFSTILWFTPRNLQKGFTKHGADFGLSGNWNPARAAEFSAAINKHINAPGVQRITGHYRGKPGFVHYLDESTGLNVVADMSGNYVTGFRLGSNQLSDLLSTGGFW